MRKFALFAASVVLALAPAAAQTMDFAKTTERVVNLGHGIYAIIASNPAREKITLWALI